MATRLWRPSRLSPPPRLDPPWRTSPLPSPNFDLDTHTHSCTAWRGLCLQRPKNENRLTLFYSIQMLRNCSALWSSLNKKSFLKTPHYFSIMSCVLFSLMPGENNHTGLLQFQTWHLLLLCLSAKAHPRQNVI